MIMISSVQILFGRDGWMLHVFTKTRKFNVAVLWWISCNGGVVCPQVVYSSSARELKVETVKPDTPEKEEEDIDIDAI